MMQVPYHGPSISGTGVIASRSLKGCRHAFILHNIGHFLSLFLKAALGLRHRSLAVL